MRTFLKFDTVQKYSFNFLGLHGSGTFSKWNDIGGGDIEQNSEDNIWIYEYKRGSKGWTKLQNEKLLNFHTSPSASLLCWLVNEEEMRGLCRVVKCTLVQALRLCRGRTAHRGSRGIALLFLDHGTRKGWGVSVTPRPLFTPWIDPVPTVQEAGWAPGLVWTGAENLASHRDSITGPPSP